MRTVRWLASEGFDLWEAAFNVLDYRKVIVIVPQHALTLNQAFALIYMLYPMDEAQFANDLARKLRPGFRTGAA